MQNESKYSWFSIAPPISFYSAACITQPYLLHINTNSGGVFLMSTAQKMKFSIENFFSKCDPIRSFLWIWSHLMKKSLINEKLHFCALKLMGRTYLPWKPWHDSTRNLKLQRHIQNPVKHIKWSILRKRFTAESRELFS